MDPSLHVEVCLSKILKTKPVPNAVYEWLSLPKKDGKTCKARMHVEMARTAYKFMLVHTTLKTTSPQYLCNSKPVFLNVSLPASHLATLLPTL